MKTKMYLMAACLVCVAYLACSCTPTTTWRQIRSNPQKYVAEEVCIKGRVERVDWNSRENQGDIILRDRNHDTGPVRFCVMDEWRGPGERIAVLGKVQQEQRETGLRTYVLARELKDSPKWEQGFREAPVDVACLAIVVSRLPLPVVSEFAWRHVADCVQPQWGIHVIPAAYETSEESETQAVPATSQGDRT